MTSPDPALLTEALAWADADPDPATAAALRDLVARARSGDAAAAAELADCFAGRLAFGTAGLRAALGPGPNRMNRVVVQRAAAGLARWLVGHGHAGAGVLVGYDARHNSAVFAADTAEILAGHGLKATLTPTHLPTPLVPFGVGRYGLAAGVVVTASHNPSADNGYKVYVGQSQIVPPTDAEIAAEIAAVSELPVADLPRSTDVATVGPDLVNAYVARAAALVPDGAPRELRWVYTAMHGVGRAIVERVVAAAGFPAPAVVAEQADPDPDFPTVAFPNPEEPGAIDLALALARATDADVAVANDPDADRCAIAAPIGGAWRMLTGDELGTLLAADALSEGRPGVYACSVVSSTMLATMAAAHGRPFETTLTGFKWIGRVPGLAFGYEEAIGYCTDPASVPDKDGITALVRVLALVARLRAEGRTVADALDDLVRTYGLHHTAQMSFRVGDLTIIADAMRRLRARPPATLAGVPVTAEDLADGWRGLPPTDAVLLAGGPVRVVVRPSGTEPKLKCYLQVTRSVAESADPDAARAAASGIMARVQADVRAALGL
nr:phospho-sugar mutase [Propionibacterium sp.]